MRPDSASPSPLRTFHQPPWTAILALVFLLVPHLLASTATADHHEADTPSAASDPMAALASWEGHWRGEGWIRMGPGEPAKIDSEEWIEARLDGQALIIEGLHHDQDSGRKVHHALALLTWDPEAETYRFRTQVTGRGPGDFEGRMEDGAFLWGGPAGNGGQMRYTIHFENDTWHEVGEFSTDGDTWNQFFEMTLKRVP